MNIGFLVPWPLNADLTSYWALWASAFTALGTFLLAAFAYAAWVSAKATLKGQQRAVELSALNDYVKVLSALQQLTFVAPDTVAKPRRMLERILFRRDIGPGSFLDHVSSLCSELESAGLMWRQHHRELFSATNPFEASEFSIRTGYLACFTLSPKEMRAQLKASSNLAGQLKLSAIWWQNETFPRSWIVEAVVEDHKNFHAVSPAPLFNPDEES